MKLKVTPYTIAIRNWTAKIERRYETFLKDQEDKFTVRDNLQGLLFEIDKLRRNLDWLEANVLAFLATTTLEEKK